MARIRTWHQCLTKVCPQKARLLLRDGGLVEDHGAPEAGRSQGLDQRSYMIKESPKSERWSPELDNNT